MGLAVSGELALCCAGARESFRRRGASCDRTAPACASLSLSHSSLTTPPVAGFAIVAAVGVRTAPPASESSRPAKMTPAPGERVGDQGADSLPGEESAGEPDDEDETTAGFSALGGGEGATGGVGVRVSGRYGEMRTTCTAGLTFCG